MSANYSFRAYNFAQLRMYGGRRQRQRHELHACKMREISCAVLFIWPWPFQCYNATSSIWIFDRTVHKSLLIRHWNEMRWNKVSVDNKAVPWSRRRVGRRTNLSRREVSSSVRASEEHSHQSGQVRTIRLTVLNKKLPLLTYDGRTEYVMGILTNVCNGHNKLVMTIGILSICNGHTLNV